VTPDLRLPVTGSDVDTILARTRERAELASRDVDVLAGSDRRYRSERYKDADRVKLLDEFARLKLRAGRR
jgi:hypothetical protein